MNPQDLLYTNQFENTNIISSKNLADHTKHYKQYQKHIHKTRNPTEEYLSQNNRTGDKINVDKRNAHPTPASSTSNIKPMFSTAINDIVDHKYSKSTRTAVSIYSDDRDKTKYIVPNNYVINLGKDFTNIYKIKLIDIDIPAIIPPINRRNNVIKWIYPTNELVDTCAYDILPFAPIIAIPSNSDIYITGMDNEFSTSVPSGFYTTTSLSNELENKMNTVLFNTGTLEDPGYIPHHFTVDINPHKSITSIINRINNVYISGIQTIMTDRTVSCNIILNAVLAPGYTYNPIIITGLPFTNNGVIDMLNLTECYDSSIVPSDKRYSIYNNSPEIAHTNYHSYSFTVGTDSFPQYDKSVFIYASQDDFVVFDKNLATILTDAKNFKWRDFTDNVYTPLMGKALSFALKNKFTNTTSINMNTVDKMDRSCIDPLLSILYVLGWNISKYKTDTVDEDRPFKFVHRNTDMKVTSVLNVELLQTGDYIFKSPPFIFLKISFPTLPADICAGQLVRSTSDISSKLSTEYYHPLLSSRSDISNKPCTSVNTGCITDNYVETNETLYEILEMDDRHLFAKINISSIQGASYNIRNYDYEFLFYETPLNNINQIRIELLSSDGRLLELNQDHNITLEILESIDVLKETLLDTKHNNIVTTGVKLN